MTPHDKLFTIYLPTKYRLSANIKKFIYDALIYVEPTLRDDISQEHAQYWFEGLMESNKKAGKPVLDKIMEEHFPNTDKLIYVDYYDGFFVFFDAKKAMEAVKATVKEQHKWNIGIGEIIIADIQEVKANIMSDEKLYQPCGKENYEDYPAKYVFDKPF